MRKLLIFILSLFSFLSLSAGIYNPDNIPIPVNGDHPSYISNPDGILSDSICAVVNDKLFQLEDSTGVKTLVIVVEHVEGDDIYQFSLAVGNKYGIGNKDDDRGLIIALATLDRSYQILTGHGLEAELPDAKCYKISSKVMVPRLKENAWGLAISETVEAVSGILMNEASVTQQFEEQPKDYSFGEVFLGILVSIPLFGLLLYALFLMLKYILMIPNMIYTSCVTYREIEYDAWGIVRFFLKIFNYLWCFGISLYYKDALGNKVFYVDNRESAGGSGSGGGYSGGGYSGGHHHYSGGGSRSSGGSHGSRGGGSFGGGGSGGRF